WFQYRDADRPDEYSIDVEFIAQLTLPLLAEVQRTEHAEALDLAAIEQLAGDQPVFRRLAQSDVVGNQQADRLQAQCHEQWHELIRAWLECDATERAQRSRGSPKAEAGGIAQQRRR